MIYLKRLHNYAVPVLNAPEGLQLPFIGAEIPKNCYYFNTCALAILIICTFVIEWGEV